MNILLTLHNDQTVISNVHLSYTPPHEKQQPPHNKTNLMVCPLLSCLSIQKIGSDSFEVICCLCVHLCVHVWKSVLEVMMRETLNEVCRGFVSTITIRILLCSRFWYVPPLPPPQQNQQLHLISAVEDTGVFSKQSNPTACIHVLDPTPQHSFNVR